MRLAKLSIVFLIHSGEDDAAKTALDNLITDFNSHPGLATAVFVIGEQYYYKAFEDPNKCRNVKSEEYLVRARNVWERIITELDVSQLNTTHAYYYSATCYRKMGDYEKAVEYYQKVVSEWPDYEYAGIAQCLVGDYLRKLIDLEKSSATETEPKIEKAYMAVIENYTDSLLAPDACLKMARISLKRG